MLRRKAVVSDRVAALVFVLASFLAGAPAFAATAPSETDWSQHGFIQTKLIQNQAIKTFAIEEIIEYRCHRYLEADPHARCRSLARKLHELLDESNVALFDESADLRVQTSVAFRSELVALSGDQKTYYFLKDLNSELELSAGRPSLWNVALRDAGTEAEALRWIAVLFQDTSTSQTQVYYLAGLFKQTPPTVVQTAVLAELRKAVATLIQADRQFQSGAGGVDLLEFYPPDADANDSMLGGAFYHYYVPAYLAQKLAGAGFSAEEAVFGSFVFNYLYKIYKTNKSPLTAVFEPKTIADPVEAVDIFAALLGAYRGVGLAGRLEFPQSAYALIQQSPRALLRELGRQTLPIP